MLRNLLAVLTLVAMHAVAADVPQTATLDIKGMDCASCPLTVKLALKKTPGVTDVKVSYQTKSAEVQYEAGKATPEKLAQVVTDLGYPTSVRKPPK